MTEGGESPSEENPWFRAIGTEVKTENNMLWDVRMLLGVKDMLAVWKVNLGKIWLSEENSLIVRPHQAINGQVLWIEV